MDKTFLVVKPPTTSNSFSLSFSDVIAPLDTIVSISISSITPNGINVVVGSGPYSNSAPITVSGGFVGSYSCLVTVTTGLSTFAKILAVVVKDNIQFTYDTQNINAVNALVGSLQAGESAVSEHSFILPDTISALSGYVVWELLDATGVQYSQGNCFDFSVASLPGSANQKISSKGIVTVPSNVKPTLLDQAYQLRWTLVTPSQSFYSFEALTVTGSGSIPLGTEDLVELDSSGAILNLGLYSPFDSVSAIVYQDNTAVTLPIPATSRQTSDGWNYSVELSSVVLVPRLSAYSVIWRAKNSVSPSYVETHTGRLFITTPSILSAVDDMRILINKSRTSINGSPDILFSTPLLLAYLRRGRDMFNGAQGQFTDFDMTNAQGSIRDFWLRYSEVYALRSQYLAEGEKAFNFTGQAISLEVDKSQFYQAMADSLQQSIDNDVKPFKQNLIKKGIISGDGNAGSLSRMRPGSLGTVGITISPVTNWGGRYGSIRR